MNEYIEQFDLMMGERNQDTIERDSYDKVMLFSVICLALFGVLMVYSATSVVPPANHDTVKSEEAYSQFHYLKRHIFSLSVGIVFMFLSYRFRLKSLYSLSYVLIALSIVLIALVFVPGIGMKINGAKRWIRFWPSSFQPSEFAKFAMIVFLARYLSSARFNPNSFICFLKPLFVMTLFQAFFLMQPDFGSTITLSLITFTMLFLAGSRLRYLLGTSMVFVPVALWLVQAPYRLKRITSFLDPWSDPLGAGYQLVQSFIALGSGGLIGTGLGESKQKLSFLPYANTDFIFSLMGEELGFAGISAVLIFFVTLFIRGIKIASGKRDPFHYYLGQGLTYLIIYQVLINVAVVTGLVPTKGLPLPFISYGGSAIFVNMIAVGFLLNLSKRYQPVVVFERSDNIIQRKKAKISIYGRQGYNGRIR